MAEEVTATKEKKVKAPKDPHALGEKSFAVLEIARGMSGEFTAADIAAAMNLSAQSVNGSLTALQKKGLIVRGEPVKVEEDGKAKFVKFITVTDEGKSTDYFAEAAK
jgi:DNA-binding MarR family transcriptional regulator